MRDNDIATHRQKTVLDALEQRLLDSYTTKQPYYVKGNPGAHEVWLRFGGSHFCVTPAGCDTAEDAEWVQAMLAKALANIVRDQQK